MYSREIKIYAHAENAYVLVIVPQTGSNPSVHRPADGQINKLWYIHRMENYLAINKNEVLVHTTTWTRLKCVVLMKEVKHGRLRTVWFHLYEILGKVEL